MKSLLVLFLLAISAHAQIGTELNTKLQPWAGLELDQTYLLEKFVALPLQQPLNCSGSKIVFHPGKKLPLKDMIPLDDIHVLMYRFEVPNCGCPKAKSVMTLVDPVTGAIDPENPSGREVGLIFDQCVLDVFVENKNINDQSIFSSKE